MAQRTSHVGQRVDRVRVSDTPQSDYRNNGTPILLGTEKGGVIEKAVRRYTMLCPDCSIEAQYNEKAEPICPNCGLICDAKTGKKGTRPENMIIDAKSAGRTSSEDHTTYD